MAQFTVIGFISSVRYLPDSCVVYVSEYKRGYKKNNGEVVDDKYLSWKVIYKSYFKKFVSSHFSDGMLVEIKGELLPYAIDHDKMVDGYSVIGQTINIASFPKSTLKHEIKLIKDSRFDDDTSPNIEDYNTPDF